MCERKISAVELFASSRDSDDNNFYSYMNMSAFWASKVERSLSVGQILLGFFTLGIFFAQCLLSEPTYESYSEERVYRGTIQFDYLFRRACNLVKKKLKEEKIVFEGFRIDYYHDRSYNRRKSLGVFQNINDEFPISYIDTKARKKEHCKGNRCSVPIDFSILCKVIIE